MPLTQFDFERFRADQKINLSELDVAVASHAEAFSWYVMGAVNARSELDLVKALLETTEAGLALAIRKDPETYGLDGRVTEASVNQTVLTIAEFQKARQDFFDAKAMAAIWDGAVSVMEHRKRMIESSITLLGQNYFAGPSVPRDLVSVMKQLADGPSATVEKQLARTRRIKKETL